MNPVPSAVPITRRSMLETIFPMSIFTSFLYLLLPETTDHRHTVNKTKHGNTVSMSCFVFILFFRL